MKVLSVLCAGCLGKTLPGPGCKAVGTQCTDDAECCSFGCDKTSHLCAVNPVDGGEPILRVRPSADSGAPSEVRKSLVRGQ